MKKPQKKKRQNLLTMQGSQHQDYQPTIQSQPRHKKKKIKETHTDTHTDETDTHKCRRILKQRTAQMRRRTQDKNPLRISENSTSGKRQIKTHSNPTASRIQLQNPVIIQHQLKNLSFTIQNSIDPLTLKAEKDKGKIEKHHRKAGQKGAKRREPITKKTEMS